MEKEVLNKAIISLLNEKFHTEFIEKDFDHRHFGFSCDKFDLMFLSTLGSINNIEELKKTVLKWLDRNKDKLVVGETWSFDENGNVLPFYQIKV